MRRNENCAASFLDTTPKASPRLGGIDAPIASEESPNDTFQESVIQSEHRVPETNQVCPPRFPCEEAFEEGQYRFSPGDELNNIFLGDNSWHFSYDLSHHLPDNPRVTNLVPGKRNCKGVVIPFPINVETAICSEQAEEFTQLGSGIQVERNLRVSATEYLSCVIVNGTLGEALRESDSLQTLALSVEECDPVELPFGKPLHQSLCTNRI